VAPKVWTLTQISRSRIFQNKTVPQILDEVLEGFDVDNEIQTDGFEPRNYCVQYRESDWDFISRLMEEEGIYYYFEHTKDNHRLILGNTPGSHRVTPTAEKITYAIERSELNDQWIPSIYEWNFVDNMFTGKHELRDYHFQLPTNNLQAVQTRLSMSERTRILRYMIFRADMPNGLTESIPAEMRIHPGSTLYFRTGNEPSASGRKRLTFPISAETGSAIRRLSRQATAFRSSIIRTRSTTSIMLS
jgi:hypothetical protein